MENTENVERQIVISIPSHAQVLEYYEKSCSELGISRTALGQDSVGYSKLHKNLTDGCDIRLSTLRGLVAFVEKHKAGLAANQANAAEPEQLAEQHQTAA